MMIRISRSIRALPLLLPLLAACATRSPVPAPVPVQPAPRPFAFDTVWSREPAIVLQPDSTHVDAVAARIPHLFTRMEVLMARGDSVYVRCTVCARPGQGWVDTIRLVYGSRELPAASGGDLTDFLLALRGAAAGRRLNAIRDAMHRQFTHSLSTGDGIIEAMAAWEREGHRSLDRLPELLDQGVHTLDERIWAAPPGHLLRRDHSGLRAGFRKERERWWFIFLVGRPRAQRRRPPGDWRPPPLLPGPKGLTPRA